MRYKIFFALLLLSNIGFSQKEANIWYFGVNAGLDFNSGSPVALTNGQLVTDEGCATLSDSNGDLLFYTDGITVYNKNHVVMLNGNGLLGHPSSAQSATIVPKPGSGNLFYLFTLDDQAHPNGFRYSVIDLNLDGGLGGITAQKNILILTPTLENIGITKHANGVDFWVVTTGYHNNSKHAYRLSSAGLSATAIISNVGTVVTNGDFNEAGFLKFAPSGTKLAMTSTSDFVELFDFDNSTGVVSNAQRIYSEPGELYGVEFSPNEQLLYISNSLKKTFYQFNLAASNISASKISLDEGKVFGALQMGPDSKIYLAITGSQTPLTKLSVINNPDVVGLGCNYQYGVIDLAGKESKAGLPAFNQSFFNPSFKAVNLCLGDQTHFTLNSSQVINSILWNFGDGTTSTALSPNHQFVTAGNHTITVTVTTTAFGTITKGDTIIISAVPTVAIAIANRTICGATGSLYDLTQHNAAILGSQSAATYGVAYFDSLINLSDHANILAANFPLIVGANTFYAKIYNKANPSCYDSKSFTVTFGIKPVANTPPDIYMCDNGNDNIESFNLDSRKAAILNGQNPTDFTVSYHLNQPDATANNNPQPAIFTNTTNPQPIFVRVTSNQNSSCYDTTSFNIGLWKMPVAVQPADITTCDDASNNGMETFNLGNQTTAILGSQLPADFTVSYHFSPTDAISGLNPLPSSYQNATAGQQPIYIRLTNNLSSTCFDASKHFNIIVKPKPQIVMADSYSICEGTFKDITAPSGFSTYEWKKGTTVIGSLPTIRITVAGTDYSLKVTKNYGTITCDDTKAFVVNNSNKAKITKIDINDWTENENTIEVFADGDGIYEYSLDNSNYQDSPVFTGLGTGQYTVYVNEKNCGISFKEIFLLTYPKYFTPNNDGVNDYWKIKFSEAEPHFTIKIFDRFGVLIKSLAKNASWNGLNQDNSQVQADDYWFVVTRENGKEYKGHFSLMR